MITHSAGATATTLPRVRQIMPRSLRSPAAQWRRRHPYETGGREFESARVRHQVRFYGRNAERALSRPSFHHGDRGFCRSNFGQPEPGLLEQRSVFIDGALHATGKREHHHVRVLAE
jgi:hypothetical protein